MASSEACSFPWPVEPQIAAVSSDVGLVFHAWLGYIHFLPLAPLSGGVFGPVHIAVRPIVQFYLLILYIIINFNGIREHFIGKFNTGKV